MKSTFLRKFFLNLASTFDQEDSQPTAPAPEQTDTSRKEAAAKNREQPNYKNFVRGVQKGRSEARKDTVTKFHLISLSGLRDKLGEQWEDMSQVVLELAEKIIARRLTPADVFTRTGEDSFNVLFCGMTEDQARFKAEAITNEIQGLLLGDAEPPPEPLVRFSAAEVEDAVPEKADLTDDELFDRLDDFLSKKLEEDRQSRIAPVREGQPIVSKLVYRPTLFSAKKVILIFNAVPMRRTSTGGWLRGGSVYPRDLSDPKIAPIDLQVLKMAAANLKDLLDTGNRSVVLVPIHVDTIRHQHRKEVFQILSGLSEDEQRSTVIELIGITPGTPIGSIIEVVSLIKPLCRAIFARVSLSRSQLGEYVRNGVNCIGVDLTDPRSVDGTSTKDQGRLLMNIHQTARMLGARSYVFSVNSPELLDSVLNSGFDYINGEALAPEISTIGQPYIYRNKTVAGAS